MALKIVKYPHPALRHPARPISLIDASLRKIVADMLETMYEHQGLGLAAPQVALPYQIFVMNPTGDPQQRDKEQVFINPELSDPKGIVEAEEGCLSFPDLYQKVRRARQVRVQAYDAEGRLIDRVVTDLESRIVQHETDHLHGKLFIDYFGPGAKLSSRAILEAFEKEHRRAQERGELPSDAELLRQLKALEKEPIVVG